MVDESTGEVLVEANTEITDEVIETLVGAGIKSLKTIYTNDLEHGPYISDTVKIDPTNSQLEALVEIYRMMRPGEPTD